VVSDISRGRDAPSHQPAKAAVTVSKAIMMLTPKMNIILFIDSILNINAISSLFVHDYIKNRGKGDVN